VIEGKLKASLVLKCEFDRSIPLILGQVVRVYWIVLAASWSRRTEDRSCAVTSTAVWCAVFTLQFDLCGFSQKEAFYLGSIDDHFLPDGLTKFGIFPAIVQIEGGEGESRQRYRFNCSGLDKAELEVSFSRLGFIFHSL